MPESRATTIRFSEHIYKLLEQASKRGGLPINSVVAIACIEWLEAHPPEMLGRFRPPGFRPPRMQRYDPMTAAALVRTSPGPRSEMRTVESAVVEPPSSLYPFELFSTSAQQALAAAQKAAEQRAQGHIGTEHLLAGLLGAHSGLAARVLAELGFTVQKLPKTEPPPELPQAGERLLPTSMVRSVLRHAYEEARAADLAYVGTEHILLGILLEGDCVAAGWLNLEGVTQTRARELIAELGARED